MSSLLHVVKRNGKNTKIQKYVNEMFRKTSKKNTKKYFLSINTVEFGLYFSIRLLRFSVTWGTDTPGSTSWRQVLYTFFFSVTVVAFQPACWWGSGTFLLSDPYDTCTLEIIVFLMVDIFHNRIWRNNPYLTWCAMLASALYMFMLP